MPAPANISIIGMRLGLHLELDLAVVERAGAELRAQLLPGGGAARPRRRPAPRVPSPTAVADAGAREQELEEPLLRGLGGALGDALGLSLLTMSTASSTRSRTIDSTSRPT